MQHRQLEAKLQDQVGHQSQQFETKLKEQLETKLKEQSEAKLKEHSKKAEWAVSGCSRTAFNES